MVWMDSLLHVYGGEVSLIKKIVSCLYDILSFVIF